MSSYFSDLAAAVASRATPFRCHVLSRPIRFTLAIAILLGVWSTATRADAQTDQPGAPAVVSIVRTTPSAQVTRASSVVFTVTFSEAVTNVGTDSFTIAPVNGGDTVATVSAVTGGPSVYEVTVDLIGGAGDFRLDVGPIVSTFATGFGNPDALAFDSAGNLYVSDDDYSSVRKVTSAGVVSTFATGFSGPYGMTFSAAGDLYVASYNQVKKVTPGGVVSTFATGFNVAGGLAFDAAGNLYVGNYGNSTISKVTPGGAVSTFLTDINAPFGLTFDTTGNLYVASRDAATITKVTPAGVVSIFASGLAGPQQLGFDAAGDLFVADRWAGRVAKVTPDGTVSTYATGMGAPAGIAIDAAGAIYVSSYYVDRIVRKLTLPVINDLGGNPVPALPYTSGEAYTYDPNDAPTDIQLSNDSVGDGVGIGATIGTFSTTDADGADTHTYSLVSGSGDADNSLFVINGGLLQVGSTILSAGYHSVRVQTDDGQGGIYAKAFTISVGFPQITSILRKTPLAQTTGISTAVFEVTFSEAVTGVVADGFVVTPVNGGTVAGTVTAVSGGPSVYAVEVSVTSGTGEFRLDAIVPSPIAAVFATGFNGPSGLAFDGAGNLFVSNSYDNTVSEVTSGGGVSLFASGFNSPVGLAFDGQGNLYVANQNNNTVSKVTSGGSVSLFASGFNRPNGLAFDGTGNLYVANTNDNTVRKVASDGTVNAFANGFNNPTALAFNSSGDLYVGNRNNNSVSKVTSDGTGAFFSDGFDGAAGLAFDSGGNLYVANNWSGAISRVTPRAALDTLIGNIQQPTGLAMDGAGNLYVASMGDGTIIRLALPISIKDLSGAELPGLPYTSGQSYIHVINAAPTDITLSANSVNQSAGTNATIGALTTTDADSGDTHTYTLVSGTGDTDNPSFNLSGVTLQANNSAALPPGSHSVRIRSDDGLSNPFEKAFTITVVDDIAPPAPSVPDLATASDTGTSSTDNITSVTTPTFTGTAEANSTVQLLRGGSTSLGTVTADGSGHWTLTVSSALSAGTYSITVKATDAAANTSVASGALSLTIDDAAPLAPSVPDLAAASDTGSSNTDNITSVTIPTFTGTAEANSTVQLFRGGSTSLGTVTADGGGHWTLTVTTALSEGVYSITATSTDNVGQTSATSIALSVTIDTTPSTAPAITAITNDTGASQTDHITTDTTLVLSGTTAANESVTVFRNAVEIGTTNADGVGLWNFDYTGTTLASGTHTFTATTTDAAGNVSNESGVFSVEVDASTPSAPVITGISDDSGSSATDGITRDATLILSGTADAGTTITISRSGSGVIGNATANGSGAWSFDSTATALLDGDYLFTAFASDTAGNTSTVSADFPVTVDTTAPMITTQPLGGTYVEGDSFILTVAAFDPNALTYQWYFGTSALSDNATRSGSATASLTQTGLAVPGFAGDYTVRVTDLAGNSVTSQIAIVAVTAALPQKADQSLTFSPIGSVTVGVPVTLSAAATSGLPVTFSVVGGNATISGTSFTAHDANLITLRATQAGDSSYNAATTDQIVSDIAKLSQAITFAAVPDKMLGTAAFALNASATSSLPVSFTVVSGPATVSADTLTLTGLPGTVTIAAHQSGDAVYAVAADVTRSFAVIANFPAPASDGFADSVTGGAGASSQSVTVTNAADFLIYADSPAASIITVVGTVDLGTTPIQVQSNKTIQGVDGNTTLVGNLNIANGTTNVVIRGLTLTNPGQPLADGVRKEAVRALSLTASSPSAISAATDEGAAITIAGARDVFITHCSFFDCAGAAVTITNGSDNIAISWSEFGYTSGQGPHRASVLIGNAGAETAPLHVSLHHNLWSAGVDQGMPAATYGFVHLYNNYFNTPGNSDGTEALDQTQVLSERNVYAGVNNPLTRRQVNPAVPIGRILALGNVYTASTGTMPYAGTDAVFTPSYSYEMLPTSDVAAVVTAHAGNNFGANYVEAAVGSATLTGPASPVTRGTNFTLNVTPHGITPASYQWRRNNLDIPGATASSYSVTNAQETHAATYTVALGLTSDDLVVSNPVTVSLAADPVVVTPPTTPPSSGGGGAFSPWCFGALALLLGARALRQKN